MMAKSVAAMRAGMVLTSALLAGLALGGCKKAVVDAQNATPAQVAEQVAKSDLKPKPGRWESTMKIEAMDMPGMSPEAKKMMENAQAERKMATCLSKEDAEKPASSLFSPANSGCKYDHFTMADGKMDGALTCEHGPEKISMTMSGTYSPEAFAVHTTSKVEMPGGRPPMTSQVSMTSAWKGECNGTEIKAPPRQPQG
jgi:hypothetical protein